MIDKEKDKEKTYPGEEIRPPSGDSFRKFDPNLDRYTSPPFTLYEDNRKTS